jgi:hypothetical protein
MKGFNDFNIQTGFKSWSILAHSLITIEIVRSYIISDKNLKISEYILHDLPKKIGINSDDSGKNCQFVCLLC